MDTPAIPLDEFDAEMQSTRRLLERLPADRADWRPHPKSFSLAQLGQLVGAMPGWIADTLRQPYVDLGAGGEGGKATTLDGLMARFDAHVREARAALAEVTGAALDETWEMRMGDRVVQALPRRAAVRQHLTHLSHHRGQLSVYARLLDVPVPSLYGPTADEPFPQAS